MVETALRFRVSGDVVTREIPEGLMLVNVQTGTAFKLNQVGAAIWERLDGVRDVATIVGELDQQYRVGTGVLLRDVNALLEELQKQGLVGAVDRR
jgi:hypothetical protein